MYKNMQLLCTIEKSNEALKTLKNDFEKKVSLHHFRASKPFKLCLKYFSIFSKIKR